jgi:ppGpp synthetase/RelA/SpoT-type nucleotidyltranferase
MDLKDFLEKYAYTEELFNKTGLKWDDLLAICKDYKEHRAELDGIGKTISNDLLKCNSVHSVKYRIKDPEHLLEKIIRKTIEDPKFDYNIDNYYQNIHDLIGIRALHLFKEDWLAIHKYIKEKWELIDTPTAKIRRGDADSIINTYKKNDCNVEEHKFGYRSIHYILSTKFYLRPNVSEIQVRTIFEEGWSEIDHKIRYPYDQENPILLPYLNIFNRLAGSSDEMGSFILTLKDYINKYEEEIKTEKEKRKNLEKKIEQLKLDKVDKDNLLEEISDIKIPSFYINTDYINTEIAKPDYRKLFYGGYKPG